MRIFFDGDSEGTAVDLHFQSVSTNSGRELASKYHQQTVPPPPPPESVAAAVARGAAVAAARHHFNPHYNNGSHYNNGAAALVNMLTPSSNQYLRPEYLSPLPTTLDAKKSPLALLAQTCSNIGADTPSSKSLLPAVDSKGGGGGGGTNFGSKDLMEKSSSSDKSSSVRGSGGDKSTPHSSGGGGEDKSSFKPYESIIKKEETGSGGCDTEKSGFRTPTSTKSSSPCISRAGSVHSDKGCSRSSPNNGGGVGTADANTTSSKSASAAASSNSDAAAPTTTATIVTSSSLATNPISASMHSQHNRISIGCGNMFVEVNHHESGLPKDALSAHLSSLGYKPGQLLAGLPPPPPPPPAVSSSNSVLHSLSNCSGCTQADASNNSFNHALATQNSLNKSQATGYPVGSALSPYVAYARVKTVNGGTTLVPICRDPYCTNCQLSMQSAQQLVSGNGNGSGGCPSGCSQCNHEKAAAAAAAAFGGHHAGHGGLLQGMSAANVISLGAGLYTSSMLTPRPYVCNWIAGDTYCGKRFTTSDELLQHLRTHTNLSAAESAAAAAAAASLNPLLNPSLSMPSAASLGAGCHLHYSMAPSLTTAAGLHRTYPTSLSPVSSLSAANRYHPYKPPQLGAMSGAIPPPLSPFPPHPGFSAAAAAQYFSSPYAMYGQRLGAAVHP